MNEDEVASNVHRKIEREKALINAANAMRQSTNNPAVLSRLDTQIRDGRRNIEYLEGRLRELQMRKMGTDMENMQIGSSSGSGSSLNASQAQPSAARRDGRNPITPPPKDGWNGYMGGDQGGYGDPGPGGYSQQLSGGHGLMPPRAPYAPAGPAQAQPKVRANYSKLGENCYL